MYKNMRDKSRERGKKGGGREGVGEKRENVGYIGTQDFRSQEAERYN